MPEINNLSFSYVNFQVFEQFSLNLKADKTTALLGPSGCGKSTLLKVLSGLQKADKGSFDFSDSPVSFIFQEPRLLPWRTVRENLELVSGETKSNFSVESLLEETELLSFADYYPEDLSGGMRQRVSFLRAFMFQSDFLFMDEPFQGLDIRIKEQMIRFFYSLKEKQQRTILFVTHNIREAVLIADKIVLLSPAPMRKLKELNLSTLDKNDSHAVLEQEEEILGDLRRFWV